MLTQADADKLIAEPKIITANVSWQAMPAGHGKRFRFETSVLVPSQSLLLRLYGAVGKTNYSFSLVYGGLAIRKFTKHARHHNPDCHWVTKPHKHTWDEKNEDSLVYIPSDIRADDVHEALLDFLKECNIEMKGTYKAFLGM